VTCERRREKDYSVYRTSEEISPLTKWARNNEIPDEMIYKKAAGDQLCFMRDTIPSILSTSYEEYRGIQNSCLEIISSHRSKSIDLPVYKLVFRDFTFVIRDNFYNWKISVNVPILV
jgi:hypothetical protein